MTSPDSPTPIEKEEIENAKMLRKVKLIQLGLDGFQLGLLFVFFSGIQENYVNCHRKFGVFKPAGFRQFWKVPFICSFAFCTVDSISNLLFK